MPEKINGIYLTELTFFKLIWYLILRRQICILGAYSYIQNHGGIFEQIVTKLHTRGMVKTINDFKHLLPYKDSGDFQRLTNAFSESEPWMEIQFKLGTLRGSYALACKHIISNRSYALYQRNYALFYLADTLTLPALDSYDRSYF
ncbi:MAG: hypothetical protein Q8S01_07345, partial [Ignavibacteria bacterium]|nr:hypothetical protein [Ignavibacteria bacterium]